MIAACIVARDAAALLPECIASVRESAGEVLLVDDGSTDDTVAVARSEGARIVASDAKSHELARNAYLEAATAEWILVIDADERLTTDVRPLVERAGSEVGGFALERYDWIGGGRWASTRLVRLFRRAPDVRYFASTAHAAVAPAIARAGGRVALAAHGALHHLDALLDRDHAAKRADMRRRLEAQRGLPGAPPILRCFYALELFALEDDRAADAELAAALASDPRIEPIASLFRAQHHRARARFDEAERLARRALGLASDVFRGRDSAWAVLADVEDRQGRVEDAIATTRAAIAESPAVASHHLNLFALTGDERARDEALRLNPWIDSPRVLAPGARPSIFVQQDALLERYRPRPA
ncbi:MAG: glycosyltransferase [Labilithrix sp.]|nr:glycosyltransferase [Labilithrix sp.]MCW5810124.1 glycosyltransferase [Labilithrix sp.]